MPNMPTSIEIRVDRESTNDEFIDILTVYRADGDLVVVGDELIEFETSKGVVVVAAEVAGVFRTQVVAGDEVAIGAVLARIEAIEPSHTESVP